MKVAAAVVRGNFEWSTDEQILKIGHYTQSENIVIRSLIVLTEDKNIENIIKILSEIDVVIVTDETRISRDKLVVDAFKIQLVDNDVELISLN